MLSREITLIVLLINYCFPACWTRIKTGRNTLGVINAAVSIALGAVIVEQARPVLGSIYYAGVALVLREKSSISRPVKVHGFWHIELTACTNCMLCFTRKFCNISSNFMGQTLRFNEFTIKTSDMLSVIVCNGFHAN